uniref:C-signal-like isoform X1 n=1 Tax=Pristiophorus japonicus TaxID=55135 RepID=UPI00398E4C99
MADLKAETVLITGANRGIGLEIVKQLVSSKSPPARIFATCRQPSAAQELQKLSAEHCAVQVIELDVSDPASIKCAAEAVEATICTTGLNLLINNAGINSFAILETLTAEEMMAAYKTNVVGPLLVTKVMAGMIWILETSVSNPYLMISNWPEYYLLKAFLPSLKKAAQALDMEGMSCNRAAVINITSLVGSIELSRENFLRAPMYPYRISKAALNMASLCLSEDLKQYQILCTAIHPGWVQTDMGTMKAPLTVTYSVSSVLKVLASLSQNDAGKYLDWEGKAIPW